MDHSIENKLLLIEDDVFQQEIIKAILVGFHLNLTLVSDLEAAQKTLHDHWFPMVLFAEELSGGDGGIELMRQLKREHLLEDSVVIMMSSEKNHSRKMRAIDMGVDLFLSKPIDHETIIETLASAKKLSQERMKCLKEKHRSIDREKSYEEILEVLPDIVYQIDLEGRFVYVNNAVIQLGYEPKEIIGRHFSIIFENEEEVLTVSRQPILEKIKQGTLPATPCPKLFDEQRTGARRTEHLEVCLKHKQGDVCPTKVSSFGDISSQGVVYNNSLKQKRIVTGTIGVIHDITKYKEMEENLRNALRKMNLDQDKRIQTEKSQREDREDLVNRSNELETFAYRVAHDLKSPLLFMRSLVDLYENHGIAQELFLDKLASGINKSISMTNGLYNLGRLKRKEHVWANISLEELVTETSQWLETEIQSKNINLILDCFDDVYAIEDVLPLVFLNLLTNAIKYNNSKTPCIRIASIMDATGILVKVEDNGPGLPLHAEKKIFEAFVQLDKTRMSEGLGVGLNTVSKALNLHDSKIWVGRSEELGGACFSFKLSKAKSSY